MSRNILIIMLFSYTISLYFGLLMPQYREVKELQTDLVKKGRELSLQQNYLDELNRALEKSSEREVDLAKLRQGLPGRPNLLSLLELTQKTLSESGLFFKEIGQISTILVSEENNLWESRISLSVGGSYEALKVFLSEMEKSAYLVEIDTISFDRDEESLGYDYNILLRTHFLKDVEGD